jgi:hypothetical protein
VRKKAEAPEVGKSFPQNKKSGGEFYLSAADIVFLKTNSSD